VLADRRDCGSWHERYQSVVTLYDQLLQMAGADAEAAHDRLCEMFASYGLQIQGDPGDGAIPLH
jgi:hypothetical protein